MLNNIAQMRDGVIQESPPETVDQANCRFVFGRKIALKATVKGS